MGFSQIPADCSGCGQIIWIDNEIVGVNTATTFRAKIPDLEEDTVVYVDNRDHPRWLQPAIIVKRDHIHYRLRFPDKMQLWVPENWVKPVPAQML